MQITRWTQLVLFIFTCIISVRCLVNRDIPWFIYNNGIYFIESKPDYTSNEARDICIQRNMMFTVSLLDIEDILEYITSVYGHHPSFWTYDNDKYGYLMASKQMMGDASNLLDNSCYKLNTRDAHYIKENCSVKMSFLCKRNFVGASLYFVNGTRREIDRFDVETYCNPHSQEFDDVLELCVIHYFKITPAMIAAK